MLKFIGQHIVDLIARFRSDVYLEDVSTGTIASGGNLGLDSNNKIVKANEPTSHDAVTLAGSLDYITLSGQEITRNAIDLAADVTGFLPIANGGTGANNAAGARASLGAAASSHNHSATEITSGTLSEARGGTGVASLSSIYSYQYLTWEVNTNSFTSTNYELPALNGGFGSDTYTTNSGVARNPSGNGSTSFSLAKNGQQMGWYVPHACELVGISGLFRNNGSLTTPRDVAVFVGTPDVGSTNTSTYTQQAFATGDVDGGQADNRVYTTNVTLASPHSLSAGEVVMPAVCCSAGSAVQMQGNFSIIIRTSIFT